MSQVIERTSPVPYYQQLFDILRGRIVNGVYVLDERLPSENELCREFGLSRATVRQTLSTLESEGYARRVARRGVFASTPESKSGWIVQDSMGFLESQIRHGRTGIDTQVVDAGFITPPQHVAEAFGTAPGESVFALQRLRSLDGPVALFSTNWFPAQVGRVVSEAQDVLSGLGSLNTMLRQAGYVTSHAQRVIHSLPAPAHIACRLQVDRSHPVLRVRSRSWDQNELLFDYYETWVLTDVVPLEIEVAAG